MNAVEASRIHSTRRCFQRFGFGLSDDAVDGVVTRIQRGQAVVLRKLSTSRTLFAVEMEHHRTMLPVIYSRTRKTIVTVLPEETLERYRDKIAAVKPKEAAHEAATPSPTPAPPAPPQAPPATQTPPADIALLSDVVPPSATLETYVSQLGPLLMITAKTQREARVFVGYCAQGATRRLAFVEHRGSKTDNWPAAAIMLKRKLARLLAHVPQCSPQAKEAWLDRTVTEIRAAIEAQHVVL